MTRSYRAGAGVRLTPGNGPAGTGGKEVGWLMGLEPTTTGITIRDSTN